MSLSSDRRTSVARRDLSSENHHLTVLHSLVMCQQWLGLFTYTWPLYEPWISHSIAAGFQEGAFQEQTSQTESQDKSCEASAVLILEVTQHYFHHQPGGSLRQAHIQESEVEPTFWSRRVTRSHCPAWRWAASSLLLPVAKTPSSQWRMPGFNPWSGK